MENMEMGEIKNIDTNTKIIYAFTNGNFLCVRNGSYLKRGNLIPYTRLNNLLELFLLTPNNEKILLIGCNSGEVQESDNKYPDFILSAHNIIVTGDTILLYGGNKIYNLWDSTGYSLFSWYTRNRDSLEGLDLWELLIKPFLENNMSKELMENLKERYYNLHISSMNNNTNNIFSITYHSLNIQDTYFQEKTSFDIFKECIMDLEVEFEFSLRNSRDAQEIQRKTQQIKELLELNDLIAIVLRYGTIARDINKDLDEFLKSYGDRKIIPAGQ